jgi:hypothetical protein
MWLLVNRMPALQTCQALKPRYLSPRLDRNRNAVSFSIHVFSILGLAHIRSITRGRHASQPSFQPRTLSFLFRLKPSFSMHAIPACASTHQIRRMPSWYQIVCRQVRMRRDRLAYLRPPSDKPNSKPSKSRSGKSVMVQTGVSATVQRFTSMVT